MVGLYFQDKVHQFGPECAASSQVILSCLSTVSFSSISFVESGDDLALGPKKSSTKNAMIPITKPTISIIIMIPNCRRMSGWLCLMVGSGIGMGGFMTSYLTLSRIPVSLSHIIAFESLTFAIHASLKWV